MSPTPFDDFPTSFLGTHSRIIHSTDSTAGVHGEARHYLRRLFASWLPDWHDEALCRESDDMAPWFPTRGQSNQPALDICGRCPVRNECLTEAIADPTLDHGVRGGATANDRKTMRRNRQSPYIPAAEVGP
jgi:WhiB family redox-sensing transcriptional regulator